VEERKLSSHSPDDLENLPNKLQIVEYEEKENLELKPLSIVENSQTQLVNYNSNNKLISSQKLAGEIIFLTDYFMK